MVRAGVSHPVQLARAVLEYSRRPDPLGRIAPLFVPPSHVHNDPAERCVACRMLVADGALQFARAQGTATVSPGDLVAPRAREEWQHWRNVLSSVSSSDLVETGPNNSPPVAKDDAYVPLSTGIDNASLHNVQDTVGAVACDVSGSFSAGVSR